SAWILIRLGSRDLLRRAVNDGIPRVGIMARRRDGCTGLRLELSAFALNAVILTFSHRCLGFAGAADIVWNLQRLALLGGQAPKRPPTTRAAVPGFRFIDVPFLSDAEVIQWVAAHETVSRLLIISVIATLRAGRGAARCIGVDRFSAHDDRFDLVGVKVSRRDSEILRGPLYQGIRRGGLLVFDPRQERLRHTQRLDQVGLLDTPCLP